VGLLVLSSDETFEQDMRLMVPASEAVVHTARVANHAEITSDSLAAMGQTLTPAAASLPATPAYDVIAYGCTSGAAVLGSAAVARLVRAGRQARSVTTPLDALTAACAALGLSRLALLSPYVPEVSDRLRAALAERGVDTPVFGSFHEPDEPAVARIDPNCTFAAGQKLGVDGRAEAVFLSCTNLQTLPVIARLEEALGKPVLSSNQVLAWHVGQLAGCRTALPSRLAAAGQAATSTG
jgi:maleate isomerase